MSADSNTLYVPMTPLAGQEGVRNMLILEKFEEIFQQFHRDELNSLIDERDLDGQPLPTAVSLDVWDLAYNPGVVCSMSPAELATGDVHSYFPTQYFPEPIEPIPSCDFTTGSNTCTIEPGVRIRMRNDPQSMSRFLTGATIPEDRPSGELPYDGSDEPPSTSALMSIPYAPVADEAMADSGGWLACQVYDSPLSFDNLSLKPEESPTLDPLSMRSLSIPHSPVADEAVADSGNWLTCQIHDSPISFDHLSLMDEEHPVPDCFPASIDEHLSLMAEEPTVPDRLPTSVDQFLSALAEGRGLLAPSAQDGTECNCGLCLVPQKFTEEIEEVDAQPEPEIAPIERASSVALNFTALEAQHFVALRMDWVTNKEAYLAMLNQLLGEDEADAPMRNQIRTEALSDTRYEPSSVYPFSSVSESFVSSEASAPPRQQEVLSEDLALTQCPVNHHGSLPYRPIRRGSEPRHPRVVDDSALPERLREDMKWVNRRLLQLARREEWDNDRRDEMKRRVCKVTKSGKLVTPLSVSFKDHATELKERIRRVYEDSVYELQEAGRLARDAIQKAIKKN